MEDNEYRVILPSPNDNEAIGETMIGGRELGSQELETGFISQWTSVGRVSAS